MSKLPNDNFSEHIAVVKWCILYLYIYGTYITVHTYLFSTIYPAKFKKKDEKE